MVRPPVTTIALLTLMGLVYLAELLSGQNWLRPDPEALRRLGGLFGPDVYSGQPWRILTYTFVHSGFYHLLIAGLLLWFIGSNFEEWFGWHVTLAVFVFAGLGGSLASLLVHPYIRSVGASGASVGMAAAFLVPLIRDADPWRRSGEGRLVKGMITIVLFSVVLTTALPGIDGAVHLGGAAAGLVASPLLLTANRAPKRVAGALMALAAVTATLALALGPRESSQTWAWLQDYRPRLHRISTRFVEVYEPWIEGETDEQPLRARLDGEIIPAVAHEVAVLDQLDPRLPDDVLETFEDEAAFCAEWLAALELLGDGLERSDPESIDSATERLAELRYHRQGLDLLGIIGRMAEGIR